MGLVAALGRATRRSAFSEDTAGRYRERMVADEPGGGFVIAVGGRRRHQHLERQLRQRTRRHDQQMLALDEVFDLPEQRLVQRVRAGVIEGQRLARHSASALGVGLRR